MIAHSSASQPATAPAHSSASQPATAPCGRDPAHRSAACFHLLKAALPAPLLRLQTSGKIRRSTCKDLLLSGGKLEIIPGGAFDAADAKQAAGGLARCWHCGDCVVLAPCLAS
jgi:hypothetical protein